MQRIIAANSVNAGSRPVPPPTGTAQYATDGNPSSGQPATTWPAWVWNMVQEELIGVLAAAGITPDQNNDTQLLTAIRQLIQAEQGNFAVDTGTANAYIIAPNPVITVLQDGEMLRWRIGNTNTGPSTLKVNTITPPRSIFRSDGSALVASDLAAGAIATTVYDLPNTRWLLQSVVVSAPTAQIQAQAGNYVSDTGVANAHAGTYNPTLSSHPIGTPLRLKIANTNSGPSTFNPGPGAKSIVARDGTALAGGELLAGDIAEFIYNGTNYVLKGATQATNADVIAGVNTTRFVTPASLLNWFNTNAPLIKHFQSSTYTFVAGGNYGNVAHGLGGFPTLGSVWLINQTSEMGYNPNERVMVADNSTNDRGVSLWVNNTNAGFTVANSGIQIAPKTGGAGGTITPANWIIQFHCWR